MKDPVFRQKLMRLVIPVTLQNFIQALVPVADAMMLVALDQNAMSAVSLATQVGFVLQLFTFTVTSGVSMFAAQYWGKKDTRSIEELYAFGIRLMMPIAFVFFLATFCFPSAVMRIYTSDPDIIRYGASYLRIVSFSYFLNSIMLISETILKNTELVKPVTIVGSSLVVVNIFLNAVFIYGLFGAPKLEAAGAALATTISNALCLLAIIIIQIKSGKARFRLQYLFSVSKHISDGFLKYTMPILANQLGWGIGFTTLSSIMGHLGSDAVAANSVAAVVKDLISCFCFALASGSTILVGNELGAGNLERAKDYGSRLCKLGIGSGIVAGIIVAAFSPLIVSVCNLTSTAAQYLQAMLLMCVYYMVGRTMNCTVIAGIFCAGGDTKFGFYCDTITMWAFIVPVGLLAAFVLKLPVLAVYFLLNLDEMVKLPAVYHHYKKYLWVRNLTENDAR